MKLKQICYNAYNGVLFMLHIEELHWHGLLSITHDTIS